LSDLVPWLPEINSWPPAVQDEVTSQIKYAGYIEHQRRHVAQQQRAEFTPIPDDLDLDQVVGLSVEVRQKFQRSRPETLGQAGRIPGVTPAAITALMVHLRLRTRPTRRQT
jgi:tRNA uridine 5-carboxymethylaminomethyl modification enzyme